MDSQESEQGEVKKCCQGGELEQLARVDQLGEGFRLESTHPEKPNVVILLEDANNNRMLLEDDFSGEPRWFEYDEIIEKFDGYIVVRPNLTRGVQASGNFLNVVSKEIHQFNLDAGWWTAEEKKWVSVINRGKLNGFTNCELVQVKDDMHNWVDTLKENDIKKLGIMLVSTKLALAHSEISEALEGIRKGLNDDHLPERSMFEVEIADTFIRLFDVAGAMGIDLGGALVEKYNYNATRADHKKENRDSVGGKSI